MRAQAEVEAKWQGRLAYDAHHAIQIDLALRAREKKDYAQMEALLKEMRPEYKNVWETCYVRSLLLRETPLRATLKGHTGSVISVAFSSDGKRILTGSLDKTARVWDTETGQEKAVLKGHTGGVRSVAFSPDGKHILTGSDDKTARIWNTETGQEKAALKGHTVGLERGLRPRRQSVLTGSDDKTGRAGTPRQGRRSSSSRDTLIWSGAWHSVPTASVPHRE